MNCWRKEISVTHLATVLATIALSELESISIDEVGAGDKRREDREDDFPFKDPEFSRLRLDGLSLDMIVKREGSSYGCSSHLLHKSVLGTPTYYSTPTLWVISFNDA